MEKSQEHIAYSCANARAHHFTRPKDLNEIRRLIFGILYSQWRGKLNEIYFRSLIVAFQRRFCASTLNE